MWSKKRVVGVVSKKCCLIVKKKKEVKVDDAVSETGC